MSGQEMTLSTVVSAAFIRDGRVLLGRRADCKKQFPGYWDLIGGHVENGETLEAALVREAQEEIGLIPTDFYKRGTFNDGETQATYHLYVVTEWQNDPPKMLGNEHVEIRWVSLSQTSSVSPLAHPSILSALGEIATAIRH